MGGSYENRMRLPVEIVRRVREAVGPGLHPDLSPLGARSDSRWKQLGRSRDAGQGGRTRRRTIINTGIGWHEARIPTIATSVPRRAFGWVTQKMRKELRGAGLTIPLITSNRINMPEVAEALLAEGCADMVSMARRCSPTRSS